MGIKYSESRIYQIPANYVMNELQTMNFCQLQKLQLTGINPSSLGGTYWYRHGMSALSWGERICVAVVAVGPYASQITIHSECEMPTQIADWGQNHTNVVAIYNHLERYVMNAAAPTPAPAPTPTRQCPHCQKSIAVNAQFCIFCGYPV